jgi:hypothetical protein
MEQSQTLGLDQTADIEAIEATVLDVAVDCFDMQSPARFGRSTLAPPVSITTTSVHHPQ